MLDSLRRFLDNTDLGGDRSHFPGKDENNRECQMNELWQILSLVEEFAHNQLFDLLEAQRGPSPSILSSRNPITQNSFKDRTIASLWSLPTGSFHVGGVCTTPLLRPDQKPHYKRGALVRQDEMPKKADKKKILEKQDSQSRFAFEVGDLLVPENDSFADFDVLLVDQDLSDSPKAILTVHEIKFKDVETNNEVGIPDIVKIFVDTVSRYPCLSEAFLEGRLASVC